MQRGFQRTEQLETPFTLKVQECTPDASSARRRSNKLTIMKNNPSFQRRTSAVKAETMEERRIDVQYVTQTDRGRVSREEQSKAVQISALWTFKQNQDQLFLSERVHDVHWARSRRSREEQHQISVLDNTAIPWCDVLLLVTWSEQTRPCMLEWRGGKKLIKYKRDYRAKRVPFKNRCKDQESGVFSQNRYMWFQKKEKKHKKNTNSSYLWWMFLLWLCYTTRTRLNFVSLWCTYVSHKTQDDFFNVLQAMKRVSHVRVGVFPTGTHCRVHPPLSVVCICVVLHSKGNWMVCQCVFYTFFIWVQWDHVETIYDESIKRFFF